MNPALSSVLPGIKYLILRVTNRCNATCAFCLNNSYQITGTDSSQKKFELTIEEYTKIAKNLPGLVLLNLSGGEPYVREDLDQIAAQFIQHSGARYISSPTNGSFPDRVEKVAEALLKNHKDIVLKINISIDGIGKEHDQIRGLKNGYEKAIETAERLTVLNKKYKNLIFNSATTVTRENVHRSSEIVSALASTDLFEENLVNLVRDKDPNAELNIEEFKIYRKALEESRPKKLKDNRFQKWLLDSTYNEIFSLVEKSYLNKKNEFNCVAGKKMINIDERGNVAICEIMDDAIIGNLRDQDYDIYKILNQLSTKERLKSVGKRTCNCHWECAISGSILFSSKGKLSLLQGMATEALGLKKEAK